MRLIGWLFKLMVRLTVLVGAVAAAAWLITENNHSWGVPVTVTVPAFEATLVGLLVVASQLLLAVLLLHAQLRLALHGWARKRYLGW